MGPESGEHHQHLSDVADGDPAPLGLDVQQGRGEGGDRGQVCCCRQGLLGPVGPGDQEILEGLPSLVPGLELRELLGPPGLVYDDHCFSPVYRT